MIRLTNIAGPKNAPTVVIIPGGPGLSSKTLRSLDPLARSFHLAYVDFPGCNGVPYEEQTFDSLATDLVEAVSRIGGPVLALGHSFGGFFAAHLTLALPASGLICVSTPFSSESFRSVEERYSAARTPVLQKAQDAFNAGPTDQNFARWLAEYGELYFAPETMARGRELLLQDPCSAQAFISIEGAGKTMEPLLDRLMHWNGPKLFVAETLGMISTESLRNDARRGGFKFVAVDRASHFVTFDQPEEVARLIEGTFAASNQGDK